MPALLRIAGEPTLNRTAMVRIGEMVDEALASAEAAGYRIDKLLEPPAEPNPADPVANETPEPAPEEVVEDTQLEEIVTDSPRSTDPEPNPEETTL